MWAAQMISSIIMTVYSRVEKKLLNGPRVKVNHRATGIQSCRIDQ